MIYKSKMHEQYHTRRAHTLERIALNMIETHRTVRELAAYYRVPKSTMWAWLKDCENILPYHLYNELQKELALHKRKQVNLWHYGDAMYYPTDCDGPLD